MSVKFNGGEQKDNLVTVAINWFDCQKKNTDHKCMQMKNSSVPSQKTFNVDEIDIDPDIVLTNRLTFDIK
ncbi:hypothetical protein DERP_005776 [Dermatophagoides pteronyssinus]|uniref:Uncharacterized protein n=1 Tax=Dermatophagoides pteronyssinus TaxID=6956 RepID=A0ABQ8J9N6_DERPT|nr:hypothetical protein DERP_005776 [Dermatophagoides pteronyssinus]